MASGGTVLFYTRPGLQVSDVNSMVEVHFVLTSHGWYQSELALDNVELKSPAGCQQPQISLVVKVITWGRLLIEDDPTGFSFAKLQSIANGIDNLTSKFNQLFVSNKEKEYSS